MFFVKTGVVLILLLCSALSYGQHSVKGRVVDAKTMEPIEAATLIFNHDKTLLTKSDADGNFAFLAPADITSIACSVEGYHTFTMDLKRRKVTLLVEMLPLNDPLKQADTLPNPTELPERNE